MYTRTRNCECTHIYPHVNTRIYRHARTELVLAKAELDSVCILVCGIARHLSTCGSYVCGGFVRTQMCASDNDPTCTSTRTV